MVVQHFHTSLSEPAPASWGNAMGRVYPVSVWHLGDGAQSSSSPFSDGPSCRGLGGLKDRGAPFEGWLDPDSLAGCPRVAQVRQALLPEDCLLEIAVPSGGLATLETSLLLSQIQHWLNKGPDAMGEAAGPSLILIPDDLSFTSHHSVSLGSLSTEKGLGLSNPTAASRAGSPVKSTTVTEHQHNAASVAGP